MTRHRKQVCLCLAEGVKCDVVHWILTILQRAGSWISNGAGCDWEPWRFMWRQSVSLFQSRPIN